MPMRSSSHAPPLNKLLVTWGLADEKASRQDIAERLAAGLSVADGLALHAWVSSDTARLHVPEDKPVDASSLRVECQRVRETLAAFIDDLLQFADEPAPNVLAACQQRYAEVQRHMAVHLETLYLRVYDNLAVSQPHLAPLLELDATLMQALSVREHKAFAGVPGLLAKRYAQYAPAANFTGNTRDAGDAGEAGEAVEAGDPGVAGDATLPLADSVGLKLIQDARRMALAELDARMQPVLALVDAATHTPT
ncbi:MAG TPA: DUF3348 family protein [Burkholderiaceae bacterium]|nr:DUF3348 family protein [Burkholderiaceae bacterium]